MAEVQDDGNPLSPELDHLTSNEDEDDDITTEEESNVEGEAKKHKKKKKKKKKKTHSDADTAGSSGNEVVAAVDKQVKQEADRRFQKALESAKQNEDMWLLLSNAHVHDAKARKLFDALKTNSSITSINLSANHIGDEGVQALVNLLGEGGCSELINLDLRENDLSPAAEALLLDLGKKRKQLVIATGPLPAEHNLAPESSNSNKAGGGRSRGRGPGARAALAAAQQQPRQQQQQQQRDKDSIRDLAKNSPMFRQYFQTEEEDAAGASSGEEEPEPVDELPAPEEVWAQVSELLSAGRSAIPALSAALLAVSRGLDAEMGLMPGINDLAAMEDFQPHFRGVLEHLPLLAQVLQLEPDSQLHQSSSSKPQAAVGSHRVWACAILHMLLLHNNNIIDSAVHQEQLLPAAVLLALQHGHCSAVQCKVVEMVRSSLQSSLPDLWQGLFRVGFGQEFKWQQVFSSSDGSNGGSSGNNSSGAQLIPALQECLVQLASAAAPQPMGQRSCATGFVVEMANTLLQAADPSHTEFYQPALAEVLQRDDQWLGSVEQHGAIYNLLQEQDGQLCGPPPPRPVPSENGEEEEGGALGLNMSGSQLIALLSRMGELPS